MKLYVLDYNGKEFVYIPFEGKELYDTSNMPEINIEGLGDGYFDDLKFAEMAIKSLNQDNIDDLNYANNNKQFTVLQCKECKKFFILSLSEYEWFKSRNLSIPKRCLKCRKKDK